MPRKAANKPRFRREAKTRGEATARFVEWKNEWMDSMTVLLQCASKLRL
jgi:hypothetical protein